MGGKGLKGRCVPETGPGGVRFIEIGERFKNLKILRKASLCATNTRNNNVLKG
jgi:hypothetical protein